MCNILKLQTIFLLIKCISFCDNSLSEQKSATNRADFQMDHSMYYLRVKHFIISTSVFAPVLSYGARDEGL